jgi:hypothetical protein
VINNKFTYFGIIYFKTKPREEWILSVTFLKEIIQGVSGGGCQSSWEHKSNYSDCRSSVNMGKIPKA